MKIIQSRSFENKVKRFKKTEKTILDNQIREIAADPTIAQEKKGDLRGVYVHKFKIQTIQYLLAYRFVGDDLELIMIGPHENYYRDIKAHLKSK
ncbi:MAG: type II toxin-antitoxin system RelE/ParE family toxin [Actinomycetota bacterium]|nr:type II toxin-antitoxin system RelE/ParE family toxin [Actinomycetota bacterium]